MAREAQFWGEEDMGIQGPPGPAGPQGPSGTTISDCGIFKSLGADVSTGSFVAKVDATAELVGGNYILLWEMRYSGTNTNTESEFRVEVDGVEIDAISEGPIGAVAVSLDWSSFDLVTLPAGAISFKLEHRKPGGPGTLTVSNFKLKYILAIPGQTVGGGGAPGA